MNFLRTLLRIGQPMLVADKMRRAVLIGLVCATPCVAQQPRPGHWLHAGTMPPGAIGRQRLMKRDGGVRGYSQPVELRAPRGVQIAPTAGQGYGTPQLSRLKVGLQIGPVYRFQVTGIGETGLEDLSGVEIFPTVELIDRLHPPAGKSLQFPVPVDLTAQEIRMAAEGKFVTRVIYVEDPRIASPTAERPGKGSRWSEAHPGEDPLLAAQALGRPIAILRMGGRVPNRGLNHGGGQLNGQSAIPLVYGGWRDGLEVATDAKRSGK